MHFVFIWCSIGLYGCTELILKCEISGTVHLVQPGLKEDKRNPGKL